VPRAADDGELLDPGLFETHESLWAEPGGDNSAARPVTMPRTIETPVVADPAFVDARIGGTTGTRPRALPKRR
jgi:hypothetical protein